MRRNPQGLISVERDFFYKPFPPPPVLALGPIRLDLHDQLPKLSALLHVLKQSVDTFQVINAGDNSVRILCSRTKRTVAPNSIREPIIVP